MAGQRRRWIVFDGWGVIFPVGDDIADLLTPFLQERNPDIDAEQVERVYRRAYVGRITAARFWEQLGFGGEYPAIQAEYLDSRPTLDGRFVPVAAALSERFRIALLSNDLSEWSARLRRRFGVERLFDACVISEEAGAAKPDRRIFEVLLGRTGAVGADCLFIDDRPQNLAPAAALGMHSVWMDRGDPPVGDFTAEAVIQALDELPAAVDRVWGR